MLVNKKEASLLQSAIDEWQEAALVDPGKANQLRSTVNVKSNDFDTLTVYAFVAAISCGVLAFGVLVMDEKWIERMRKFFEFSEFLIGVVFAAVAGLLTWVLKRRESKTPYATLTHESFALLIVLCTGVAIAYCARGFQIIPDYYGYAVLVASVIYGFMGFYLRSKLLWTCMLITLVGAWGALTTAWSSDVLHSYFLGMNYPLRMTVLGSFMVMAAWALKRYDQLGYLSAFTWHACWLFFLFSGMLLSISGNLSYDVWSGIRQGKLFLWAIGYSILLISLLVYAIRIKDELLRDLVLAFFLLNLYVRFFEYFWDKTNKGLFFAILALSFWLLGRKGEQMRKRLLK